MAALPKGWVAVCEDESIFVYDSVVRAVWALKGSKPVVLVTGSHRKTYVFGAVSSDGRQMFRQTENINGFEFVKYLKALKRKFKKFVLFIDRAPWHRSNVVKEFFESNKDSLHLVYLPKGSPEFNPVEECWRQSKDSVVGHTLPPSFKDLKHEIAEYLRTNRFKLDVVKYLCQ